MKQSIILLWNLFQTLKIFLAIGPYKIGNRLNLAHTSSIPALDNMGNIYSFVFVLIKNSGYE